MTTRGSQRQTEDWTLDGLGNWATDVYLDQGAASVTETRNHTDFNEINQRTIAAINAAQTLDKNGNMTDTGTHTSGGTVFKGGRIRMEWDALNRLRKIHDNNNTPSLFIPNLICSSPLW